MSAFADAGFEVHSCVHNPRFCLTTTEARGVVCDSEDPESVLRALATPKGADRFVLIHHWWTHLPYVTEQLARRRWKKLCDEALGELAAAPEEASKRMRQRYDSALEQLDGQLLTRYLDAATSGGDDVLFVFTADHGESWGASLPPGRKVEHIYDLHGRWMTEETTRVPLLFWGTGVHGSIPSGVNLNGLVRGVDVAPTIAGLAGVPWPGSRARGESSLLQVDRGEASFSLDGASLVHSIRDGSAPSPRDAITVTSHNAIVPARYPRAARTMWPRFALRTEDRRYVWDGLYRMREVQELIDSAPLSLREQVQDRLITRPRQWSRLASERSTAVGPGPKLERSLFPRFDSVDEEVQDDATLEDAMRMLGYGE